VGKDRMMALVAELDRESNELKQGLKEAFQHCEEAQKYFSISEKAARNLPPVETFFGHIANFLDALSACWNEIERNPKRWQQFATAAGSNQKVQRKSMPTGLPSMSGDEADCSTCGDETPTSSAESPVRTLKPPMKTAARRRAQTLACMPTEVLEVRDELAAAATVAASSDEGSEPATNEHGGALPDSAEEGGKSDKLPSLPGGKKGPDKGEGVVNPLNKLLPLPPQPVVDDAEGAAGSNQAPAVAVAAVAVNAEQKAAAEASCQAKILGTSNCTDPGADAAAGSLLALGETAATKSLSSPTALILSVVDSTEQESTSA